jgi:hypothetical protein
MRPVSVRLLHGYRNTSYRVAGIDVRIGRRSGPMDALLSRYAVREAVFLTAWNPYSRVRPTGWNRRMHRILKVALRRHPVLPAEGSWRRWSEAHWLAFGDPRRFRRLARQYRQTAIVVVRHRHPVRLVIV